MKAQRGSTQHQRCVRQGDIQPRIGVAAERRIETVDEWRLFCRQRRGDQSARGRRIQHDLAVEQPRLLNCRCDKPGEQLTRRIADVAPACHCAASDAGNHAVNSSMPPRKRSATCPRGEARDERVAVIADGGSGVAVEELPEHRRCRRSVAACTEAPDSLPTCADVSGTVSKAAADNARADVVPQKRRMIFFIVLAPSPNDPASQRQVPRGLASDRDVDENGHAPRIQGDEPSPPTGLPVPKTVLWSADAQPPRRFLLSAKPGEGRRRAN